MVEDLNVPVTIKTRATVREADGLALSSRNVYLTAEERKQAPAIYAGLCAARTLVKKGERNAKKIKDLVLQKWAVDIPLGRLDYLNIVDPYNLENVEYLEQDALMACAVRLGKARLIDNILLPACGTQA